MGRSEEFHGAAGLQCAGAGPCWSHHHESDVMYHASPTVNRYGIEHEGLRPDLDEGHGDSVFMSPRPATSPHEDVWRVDTRGLKLDADDPDQMEEFSDVGGSYYTREKIERSRLTLHSQAPHPKHIQELLDRSHD